MSNETTMTIVGNLTGDPELGFTQSGSAWARFSVAATPRRYDQASGSWVDGETLFLRCTCWRDLAEHVTESLHKGQRVIVTGRLRQSSWETDDGEKRTAIGLDVDEIGPSLRWANAKVIRTSRAETAGEPAPQDPWQTSTVPAARQSAANESPVDAGADRPPF